jgi:hypothetical protein
MRRVLLLLTIIAAMASSCTAQAPSLTANQRHFVYELRGAGFPPSYGSDQGLAIKGGSVCHLLGTGISATQLVQQTDALKGLKQTRTIIIDTDAVLYLCPKYTHELPAVSVTAEPMRATAH